MSKSQGKFSAVLLLTRWRATSRRGAIGGERKSVTPGGATLACCTSSVRSSRTEMRMLHHDGAMMPFPEQTMVTLTNLVLVVLLGLARNVCDRIFKKVPAKNTEYTPYIYACMALAKPGLSSRFTPQAAAHVTSSRCLNSGETRKKRLTCTDIPNRSSSCGRSSPSCAGQHSEH